VDATAVWFMPGDIVVLWVLLDDLGGCNDFSFCLG
jgi:hypothetical protein